MQLQVSFSANVNLYHVTSFSYNFLTATRFCINKDRLGQSLPAYFQFCEILNFNLTFHPTRPAPPCVIWSFQTNSITFSRYYFHLFWTKQNPEKNVFVLLYCQEKKYFDKKTNNFGTLFYQLPLLDYDVKREHTTTNSPFSFSTWIQSSRIQLHKIPLHSTNGAKLKKRD